MRPPAPRSRRFAAIAAAALTASATALSGVAGAAQVGEASTPAPATRQPGGPAGSPVRAPEPPAPVPPAVPEADRDRVLGSGWRTSRDLAWTTTGDADGFHVLVATARTGYAWRTAATLREPGFDTDTWIGNACLTSSGDRLAVVYGPRTFTNDELLFSRGGFTAVVELASGRVTKLAVQTTLAYYNPGCGAGESVALTQAGVESQGRTRLLRLDAATGRLGPPLTLGGQVTSAVPVSGGGYAAVDGTRVARISAAGERSTWAPARTVPMRLTPDGAGGIVFMDRRADGAALVRRAAAGAREATTLAAGPWGGLGLARGAHGRAYLTGQADAVAGSLPAGVRRFAGTARDARVSTEGEAAVTRTQWADAGDTRLMSGDQLGGRPVAVDLAVAATGRAAGFTVDPDGTAGPRIAQGEKLSPALEDTSLAAMLAGSPSDPVEDERTCSVPRNDPHNQPMQPKPRQVEWAVDQAIMGNLNLHINRPANWKNLGMPAYQPQTLFPRITPAGGNHVPAQLVLGVAAQESNLWQTSRVAVPGVTGNPLIGNYYGREIYNSTEADDWDVHFDQADCGYGVMQITDRMRLAGREKPGETAFPFDTQRAIALDYTVNIALGLRMLTEKWNQTRAAGLVVNNGDPLKLENWFFAVWAYNSGFHPQSEAGSHNGAWGVGWLNNPANPHYPADRAAFMDTTYADAAHPQDWPYPEKVIGFAGHPPELLQGPNDPVAAYRAAWWNGDIFTGPLNRQQAQPPPNQFCDSSNECEPGTLNTPTDPEVIGEPAGPCKHRNGSGQFDLKCWYHVANTWKSDCSFSCGNELVRFDSSYAEEADGHPYIPNCSRSATSSGNALPSNALIVDDTTHVSTRPADCGSRVATTGSFTFDFSTDSAGRYASKVDLHQIGGGFNSHFYFGHSRTSADAKLEFSAVWSLGTSRTDWNRVLVHLPDHGAHTQQARYEIDTGTGTFTRTRYINQKRFANNWVSLGVYKMNGVPRVRLSTQTDDGTGDEDVAFDAVAFQPLPAKPRHVVAVLGDSYTSGEGAGSYLAESDNDHGTSRWNACRRSKNAWGRKLVLPGTSSSLGSLSDGWSTVAELGFVACSGAQSHNAWDAGYASSSNELKGGQHGEQKQARSGVLSPDTTLVMLTLGGNDGGGFSGALTECSDLGDCSADENFLPKYKGKADDMVDNLRIVLGDIARLAPNARIVLMGYPELLSRTVKCAGSWYIDMPEVAALAELVNYADGNQNDLVNELKATGMKVDYANPVDAFVGHGGCDDPEWINKVVIGPNGDGDYHAGDEASIFCLYEWLGGACLSRESFHPKDDGTTGYAGVMSARLAAIGYS